MTESQSSLLKSLTAALFQMGAKEFVYYREWVSGYSYKS